MEEGEGIEGIEMKAGMRMEGRRGRIKEKGRERSRNGKGRFERGCSAVCSPCACILT